MKATTKLVALLVSHTLVFAPVLEPLAQGGAAELPEGAKVVVLSKKVGEVIDREERDQCRIFLFARDFESAVVYQLADGSHVVEIVEDKEGVKRTRRRPLSRVEMDQLRHLIDYRMGAVTERAPAQEIAGVPEGWQPVILSSKVGETIDTGERHYYWLFPSAEGFRSAGFFQRPDSSYVVRIVMVRDGTARTGTFPIKQENLAEYREHIEGFESASSATRWNFVKRQESLEKAWLAQAITEARQRAALADTVKWTKDRWREESLNDRGGTYRGAGATLGFVLGATAGMLIGKGFQEKEVARTETRGSGWDAYTVEFYSYKNRYAPHLAALSGGIAGALIGYALGKEADKKYYDLVPRRIRLQEPKVSRLGSFLLGLLIAGPVVGTIAGRSLYAPASAEPGEDEVSGAIAFFGWLTGGIAASAVLDAYRDRAKQVRRWEESFPHEEPEASLTIDLFPVDPTALSVRAVRLPSGKTVYEYQMDMLRICF